MLASAPFAPFSYALPFGSRAKLRVIFLHHWCGTLLSTPPDSPWIWRLFHFGWQEHKLFLALCEFQGLFLLSILSSCSFPGTAELPPTHALISIQLLVKGDPPQSSRVLLAFCSSCCFLFLVLCLQALLTLANLTLGSVCSIQGDSRASSARPSWGCILHPLPCSLWYSNRACLVSVFFRVN